MSRVRWWTWTWLAVVAAIISLELYAFVDRRYRDTASEKVELLTLAENPWIRWPARVVVVGLLGWLSIHWTLGIWP